MNIAYLFFFVISFFILLKAADYAIRFAAKLARIFELSEFIISFFIVAIISALPETVISLIAHIEGKHALAFTALLGSNVIDITFVFGVVALFANGIKVESQLMKKDSLYLILLVLPLLLGIDGTISRAEGAVLVISGLLFFYTLSIEKSVFQRRVHPKHYGAIARTAFLLAASLFVMIYAGDATINSLSLFARDIGVSELFIALIIIGTGVCLPELIFTIQGVMKKHESLALGNILGVVIIDATIVSGALAIIEPMTVPMNLMRVILFFNALGACLLIYFIRTKKVLGRTEGAMLVAFYLAFVAVMYMIGI